MNANENGKVPNQMAEPRPPVAEEQQAEQPAMQPSPEAAATLAERQLDPVVRQVLGVTIRGLMVSAPGVPPHVLLNAIARQAGSLLAGAITADLSTVLTIRKGFKDAFSAGVSKEKITQPPIPTQQGAATIRRL